MANQLKMATIQSILHLHSLRWSGRRIAEELRINRETVSRYVRLARESAQAAQVDSNPANAPIGSPAPDGSKPAGHQPQVGPPISGPGDGALCDGEAGASSTPKSRRKTPTALAGWF